MKLSEVIAGAEIRVIHGDRNADISGLAYDSRKTGPGELFFSTARSDEQGRANVEDALRRGACAAVVRSWDDASTRLAITLIQCDRLRALMGVAASRFTVRQSPARFNRRDRNQWQDHYNVSD